MGAKPRQEHRKDYMVNPRTAFLYSSPAEFRECFHDDDSAKRMTDKKMVPATKGTRLGKKTFRVVVHLPNKHHADRENYLASLKTVNPWLHNTFLAPNAPLEASRIRWDAHANSGAHLIMHTNRGKRVEFFLTKASHPKGAVVNGQISFPTIMRNKHTYKNGKSVWQRSEKLMSCRVELGYFGVSATVKGKYSLKLGKPIVRCPEGLTTKGHAPQQFTKDWEPTDDKTGAVKVANAEENMAEDNIRYFYEAQGMDYSQLKLGSENMENAQQTERNYYDPSTAMVGTDESLEGYTPSDSATVDLTSNQPTANYGAEGETATYAPSEEPDMVSASSFDDPTNAEFSASPSASCACSPVCRCSEVCRCAESYGAEGEPVAVAEGTSLNGYAPIDSIEEGAPIGHGVNQYFGSAEGEEEALLDESTTDIGIEEGTSLEGFSGVDSVVVEAPLGHGVSQWYAETDGPQPPEPEGVTGQDGPNADPTNAHMKAEFTKKHGRNYARKANGRINTHDAQGYNDKMDESLGMRHRGSHSQSMNDRRDEASAMDKRGRRGRKYDDVATMDADTAGYLQDGSLSLEGYTPLESVDVDRTSYQPTQNYGAEYEGEGFDTFKTGAFFGSGWVVGVGLLTAATMTAIALGAKLTGE